MSNRVLLLLVLLMCASFAAVLGVMWSALSPYQSSGTRTRGLRIMREPPSDAEPARPASATSPTRRGTALRSPPRQQLAPAQDLSLPEDSRLEERAQAAADQTSRHLDRMESRLKRQIGLLKESRNSMLDELAAELRETPTATAAQNVSILDDETAVMVLHRLPPPFRLQVLDALDAKRGRRLRELLNSLKDN